MSSHSWLQNLRSALASGRGHHRQRGSLRATTHRPKLEVLEDRSLPSFSPISNLSVGPHPQTMVTADFNHDGHLDLAAANAGSSTETNSNTVSVLLGNGQGGFGAASHFAAGLGPRAMAVADFDNDTHVDLATANDPFANWWDYLAGLSILPGNGTGAFPAHVDSDLWATSLAMAMADFNADGNVDLVYSQSNSEFSAVEVRLGDGQGGFVEFGFYELSGANSYETYPIGLAVTDLNADGMPDVVTANKYDHTVSVLLNNGDGSLSYDWNYEGISSTNFATGSFPLAVAVGDFTGDGIPDLVTAGQTVDILPGFGDGTFDEPIQHSANTTGMTTVAATDFNDDGYPDVVTADPVAGTVSIHLGLGDGTLLPPMDHATGSYPRMLVLGDFDEDGQPDVAAANGGIYAPYSSIPTGGSNTVSVLLNDGVWPDLGTPWLRIDDAPVTEGNTGAAVAGFTVTLSAASTQTITVTYATANGTATAGSDYTSTSGTLTFTPGEITKAVNVPVLADRQGEPNETFVVSLSNVVNAWISDPQGLGTILDDEPRIRISDVTKAEGKRGQTTLFTFTITLSTAYDQAVTMSFRTVNATATSSNDYIAKTGTLTFAPGETTKTITIEVKGDSKKEANETFYLDLFGNSSNSLFTKNRGLGTILNDD